MPLSQYDIDLTLDPGTSHAIIAGFIGSNKRVLDVGCDTGYLGRAIAGAGNVTSGVEYNPVTAEEARKHLHRVVVADLEAIDLTTEFGQAAFDVVVFGDVLEHLRDPLPVLRSARPLLAPGGSVIISVPNIAHGAVRLALLQGKFEYTPTGLLDATHTRFFTRDSLVSFLHDAGFVAVEIQRTRAGLFETEIELSEDDFDAKLLAELSDDVEATTYQFVVRAVLDDAGHHVSETALRLEEAERTLEELRLSNDDAAGLEDHRVVRLERDLADLRNQLRDAIDAAHGADAARASVEARLRHAEYALAAAQSREAETADMIHELHSACGGDLGRLLAVTNARSFRVYWRLLQPYRRLRGSK